MEAYNLFKCLTFLENDNVFQNGNQPQCQDSLLYVQLSSDRVFSCSFLVNPRYI